MHTVKLTTIGNSVGIILPKEVLGKLNVSKGDTLVVSESPTGVHLTPFNPDFERQLKLAEEGMNRYRDALHELAK